MLSLYNTMIRHKQEFTPLDPPFVGVYVCGPTVYGHSHLGHGKSYVSFDVLLRYLRYLDYKVRYVQNITDVGHLTDNADSGEDKLQKQARLEKLEPMEIAEKYTASYFHDMDLLGNLRPDISPRASGHVPEQIELVKTLMEKGHAYEVSGNVYFDVSSFPDYGKLSGRTGDDQKSGIRVCIADDKRNPRDFALWKNAGESHLLKWNSPWGWGYPGWHLECSAMAMRYLGETLDIHGGGLENVFPHHECEIAQSTGATGKEFVRYWMHNNMVT
ncbi:MAG: cysteine--tRNA ligase, partial [Candidatus Sabulitectum sp.]|nr:cysteine--tRNA ligase [Candidatus Sabulitectum sp.]